MCSSSPVSSEDFPVHSPKRKASRQAKRLNSKLRMEMVLQEREEMFKKLEAEHKRRVWELQAQVGLDDAGISAGTSKTSAHSATVAPPNSLRCNPETPSRRASTLPGPFEGSSGAWGHGQFGNVQGNNDFGFSWYNDEAYSEEDTIDEHIDFYLDDDSISVSERTRPLTYVSPQRSHDGSYCPSPQRPSTPDPGNVDALPPIPPVSPLHFTEFGVLADPAEHSHRFSGSVDGQCGATPSERPVETVEKVSEGDLDRDTLGPASRGSSGIVPRMGLEIRAVAPPRPARGPVLCITHLVERQNGCQRCEAGTFQEIGLKPGERMNSPEPEPEQF
ncbi:hypothetical protein LZ30DRAFT_704466 [Colletotrichum cereale]|nr:hypothetical protein LZ30DRAFT_704466 [Colletotrichum cereale]